MSKRKLLTKVGWVELGAIFWTDKIDGGPFRMLQTDEPAFARPALGPSYVIEGQSFASAVRVSDGGLVSLDATHPAWVLSKANPRRPR